MRRLSLKEIRLKHLMFGIILTVLVIVVFRIRASVENVYVDHAWKVKPTKQPMSSNYTIHDVLLIGYVMGGTVFPAEVLGMRSGHFYVQEPLHKIAKHQYFKPGYICNMLDMQCNATTFADREALGIVQAVYQCDNTRYKAHLRMWQLRKIVGDQSNWQQNVKTHCGDEQHKDCRARILSQCSVSVSRVVSTPRLSLSLASRLLEQIPKLKIIHVLRDPRAMMNSILRAKWPLQSEEINTARSVCQKLRDDLAESSLIKRVLQGRILTVFHENLATTPEKTMQEIFDFVGYKIDEKGLLLKKSKKLFYDNSTLTAELWRTQVPWHVVKVTNDVCADLYRLLGYPGLVDRYELYNNSIPLLIPTNDRDTIQSG
ncbi:carbohydrate sulfotransferase 3-like [Mizuhopecten yessoensis]|uniref:Carbohydrate sulfotransferase 3 n=1 Tax=Mizuhopecten yessoensis TaxID=6573 RepID=A0A210R6X5_MIZYE|nr:carbohydrate sulfotransferase 3-like [Mizuhopecten yessoensis]OWF56621.1 Carbohydrate sulfotransferase 3 [Mizuhopecten yessoensis]